MEKNVCRAKE
jgi:hypothetical protein